LWQSQTHPVDKLRTRILNAIVPSILRVFITAGNIPAFLTADGYQIFSSFGTFITEDSASAELNGLGDIR
jgi:hypothetical protein